MTRTTKITSTLQETPNTQENFYNDALFYPERCVSFTHIKTSMIKPLLPGVAFLTL